VAGSEEVAGAQAVKARIVMAKAAAQGVFIGIILETKPTAGKASKDGS
jgi:hypothetical protein